MTTLHLILRFVHISMGAVGLLSGAAAMVVRKGSPLHARVGTTFFVAMTIMAATGTLLSLIFEVIRINIIAGTLTLYLVATAWVTVRRAPGTVGRAEKLLAAFGVGVVLLAVAFAIRLLRLNPGSPAVGFYAVFGGFALCGVLLDVRQIAQGGLTGARRTTRHLWRMCIAMLIAALSFFIGQAKLFPEFVRSSNLNVIPVVSVAVAFLWFLVRIRILPLFRRKVIA
jgi:hypothetical protein